jgi:hypothetical protein
MAEIEAAYDIHQRARHLATFSQDPKVVRYANLAADHAEKANGAHNTGDTVGASAHLGEAAKYLQSAATLHTGKMNRGDVASPEILDVAHLGKAQELHQNYVDEINKGKNDGR